MQTAPASSVQQVPIDLGDRSYTILIGQGLLDDPAAWDSLPQAASALIVTNETVSPLYAARLQAQLAGRHRAVHTVVLPDGEEHKTWQTLNLIFDGLLANGCDRATIAAAFESAPI